MKKILFTTPVLEHPPAGGPQLRIENSIKALSKIADVYIVSRVGQKTLGGLEAEKFYEGHSKEFVYAPSAWKYSKSLFWYRLYKLKKIFWDKQKNYCFDDYLLAADVVFLLNYIKRNTIDIVWFGYGNISYPLLKAIKEKMPTIKVVCDTDSVWSRFILREIPYEESAEKIKKIQGAGMAKAQEEIEFVKMSDVVTAVSGVDAHYYKKISESPEKIKVFSNVVDVEGYEKSFFPATALQKPCLYLSGSFGPKSSMDKAARWFIKDVFPLLKSKIPDIHFYIVGNNADSTLCDITDTAITIIGKVDSVLPYLQNADIVIVPLMFESGTRFKIIEAGACGIPVVSTTLGAEGLHVTNGNNILIADEPQSFAEAVFRLIQDTSLAENMGKNLKTLVKKQYGLEALTEEGKKILDFLA